MVENSSVFSSCLARPALDHTQKTAWKESHRRFPEMDYVLLVEPDMYPVASSFNREALQGEVVYAIRRSGKESLGQRFSTDL